jgi:hypothetical protein
MLSRALLVSLASVAHQNACLSAPQDSTENFPGGRAALLLATREQSGKLCQWIRLKIRRTLPDVYVITLIAIGPLSADGNIYYDDRGTQYPDRLNV